LWLASRRRTIGAVSSDSPPPDLTVRHAGAHDAERLASLMFSAPSREAVAMAGSARAAERFQANLFRNALQTGSSTIIVAEAASGLAGLAEVSQDDDTPSFPTVARAAVAAMGLGGALRAAGRWSARLKVNLSGPEGSVHLVELQVAPDLRNRGIGGFLLARVDEHAIARNATHVSLTTATDNPARGLYERNGYRLMDEKTNARYERITGSAGRVLLVKPLVGGAKIGRAHV
jgi:ribosomal protein S18 acetylase RimI-like enzyme